MKSTIKSKISHLFKTKPTSNKVEKPSIIIHSAEESAEETKNILENEKSTRSKIFGGKKAHKKPKTDLNLLNTKIGNEFPLLPSPINDNETSKLTAQEFAKAVGIKILHGTDEEEDEECDCEYCKAARFGNTLNTVNSNVAQSICTEDGATPTQQIPNVALNQYSITNASTVSSTNNTIDNIPPFPSFYMNCNDSLTKCSSAASINTTASSNSMYNERSIINSKTISAPYHCQRNRKNSVSRVVDMSLFIPPTEFELKNRVQSSSISISSTPETASTSQVINNNNKIIGGSLDRNRNLNYKVSNFNNYTRDNRVVGSPCPSNLGIVNRKRSTSISMAATTKNIGMNKNPSSSSSAASTSALNDTNNNNIYGNSHIQFKSYHRCDSGTELSNVNGNASTNANANINPSSPNKRPYPPSLASSSSSTTLSSSFSLTYITQPELYQIPSSQSSSSQMNCQIQSQASSSLQSSISSLQRSHILSSSQSLVYSPKPMSNSSSCHQISTKISPSSSISSVTPIKPHSNLKITRSVTISENGNRQSEIDIQPKSPDEIKVYTKGRFTITCEHSRRPSVHSFQISQ